MCTRLQNRCQALLVLALAIGSLLGTQAQQVTTAQDAEPVTVIAAGDIACGENTPDSVMCGQSSTARLIRDTGPDAVIPLGDTQYECGALADFQHYYDPTWGQFLDQTYPVIGNHEYRSDDPDDPDDAALGRCSHADAGAVGYWTYFGDRATPRQPGCRQDCDGYYSFDLGTWHVVVLNSNCSKAGGCGVGSPQEQWLRADLAAHPTACTLVAMHHPRYSSGRHGNQDQVQAFWEVLYANGVDLVISGHDHHYERFAPMNAQGRYDRAFGMRLFVVGTGGRGLTKLHGADRAAHSGVANSDTYGVLRLELRATSYRWTFLPTHDDRPNFTDTGSSRCHDVPPNQ
jgi:3',5'-cyclic AMP phosphodiesterase CpdA